MSRLIGNIKKILELINTFEVSFKDEGVFNVVSRLFVLPDAAAEEILIHQKIVTKIFFYKERFYGDTSLWAPLKRENLKCFNMALSKTFKSNKKGKLYS